MSDILVHEAKKTSLDKFKVRAKKPRISEVDDFKSWLDGLGYQSAPKIHINGTAHPTASVVVDFGTPLAEPVKLTPEQSAELIGFIRSTTKALFRGTEISVRVQNDSSTGIWWATVG